MEYRRVGEEGPLLSVVGLGCNNFGMRIDVDESVAVVHAALDAGVTHFDTAEMYGNGASEEYLGIALDGQRENTVIATKYLPLTKARKYEPGVLSTHIRDSVERSLRRLGTDYIDIYYQHYPEGNAPVEEVLEALDSLVHEGKVLRIANSNSNSSQLEKADSLARGKGTVRFELTQVEWNLLARGAEESVVPIAFQLGLSVIPYFPLASGMLTGKYRRGESFASGTRLAALPFFASVATESNFDKIELLEQCAAKYGHTLAQLAIGWLLSQPSVASVIAGATHPSQVAANVSAADWKLSPEILAEIGTII